MTTEPAKVLLRDWRGRLVRSTYKLETTGGVIFPVGTIFRVCSTWRGGLSLVCLGPQAGIAGGRITQVQRWKVSLLPASFPSYPTAGFLWDIHNKAE